MSANVPTDICFSFTGLVQRGGGTGPHKDGWGITFYEGKGCRTFKDPQPSFNSPIAKLVQDYPIKSRSVIAHIRQANRGEVALENTHPFTRELWGRNWTYAHNGQLTGYKSLETGNFRPVGETDSEKAFCWLLHKLTERYPRTPGNMTAVFKYIATLASELREKGVFNMLLSDGRYVMAFLLDESVLDHPPCAVWRCDVARSGCGDRLSEGDHTERCGHCYRNAAADGQRNLAKDYARRVGAILSRGPCNLTPAVDGRLRGSAVC
ncbi:hypothetical protein L1887_60403 [Cichorium endivia]|nr:hypothetical protein L1887_60403 [Cichorium endivia]